jgi:hypothetical protein
LRTIASLLLAFVVTLTPSLASADSPERTRTGETLAVAVLAGEQLELVRIGALVFGNKRTSVALPDDAFDQAIASAISAEIQAEMQYTAKILIPDRANRRKTREAIQESIGGVFSQSLVSVPEELRMLARECSCDRLLLVLGSSITHGPNSNQRFGPIAWTGLTGLSGEPTHTSLWLPLQYLLVDPGSMKLLGSALSASDDYDGFANEPLDAKLWQPSMLEVSSEAWSALNAAAHRLMARSSKLPLFRIGLRPSCGIKFHVRRRVRGELVPEPSLPPGAAVSKCP